MGSLQIAFLQLKTEIWKKWKLEYFLLKAQGKVHLEMGRGLQILTVHGSRCITKYWQADNRSGGQSAALPVLHIVGWALEGGNIWISSSRISARQLVECDVSLAAQALQRYCHCQHVHPSPVLSHMWYVPIQGIHLRCTPNSYLLVVWRAPVCGTLEALTETPEAALAETLVNPGDTNWNPRSCPSWNLSKSWRH